MEPDLIDRDEVCRLLLTPWRNLRRLIARGEFPRPLSVGQRRLWPRQVVLRWIEKPYAEGPGAA